MSGNKCTNIGNAVLLRQAMRHDIGQNIHLKGGKDEGLQTW